MAVPYSARKVGPKEEDMRLARTTPDVTTPPEWRGQWARGEDSPYPPGTTLASIYNFAGAEQINPYGALVANIYSSQTWTQPWYSGGVVSFPRSP